MAELNNHAVLHEEEDSEDGKCHDKLLCYFKCSNKGLKISILFEECFKSCAFHANCAWEAINKQINSLFSLTESLIL